MDMIAAASQGLTKQQVVDTLQKKENTIEQEILECRGELRLKGHAIKNKEQDIEGAALDLEVMKEEFTMLTDALLDMLDEQTTQKMAKEDKAE